jgi:cell division protein FtsW
VAIAILCVIGAVISKPYRIARIVGHIDPEYKLLDKIDSKGRLKEYLKAHTSSRNTSYQADQSKIAVGAGGPLGMGLMQGKQKLLYLPEAHNDFIFAVICEELGLAGAVGLVIAFLIIFWRGLRATFLMSDEFGRYLALGVTTMLVLQAFINMSVVLGMVPTKGITLPMISYGGSSLLSTLASLGILMNVSEHAG